MTRQATVTIPSILLILSLFLLWLLMLHTFHILYLFICLNDLKSYIYIYIYVYIIFKKYVYSSIYFNLWRHFWTMYALKYSLKTLLAKTWLQYFDCLPLKINTFMSSFNNENDQCVKAHLFWFDPPPLLPIVQLIPPIVINCSAKKAPVGRRKAHFYHFLTFFTK